MTREHVHLIGIGGTGMTALAGLLQASGCRVTGSDRALYPPTSTILEALGLEVHVGFDASRLDPAPDLVVMEEADHFFHRRLMDLRGLLKNGVRDQLPEPRHTSEPG